MRPEKTLFALAMLASLVGCYPPTEASHGPTVLDQPQPLHPSYGYRGLVFSAAPLPLTLPPPCTVCSQTSAVVPVSWWP
jgi:hypothetical protein